jgi:hypothetical protein
MGVLIFFCLKYYQSEIEKKIKSISFGHTKVPLRILIITLEKDEFIHKLFDIENQLKHQTQCNNELVHNS